MNRRYNNLNLPWAFESREASFVYPIDRARVAQSNVFCGILKRGFEFSTHLMVAYFGIYLPSCVSNELTDSPLLNLCAYMAYLYFSIPVFAHFLMRVNQLCRTDDWIGYAPDFEGVRHTPMLSGGESSRLYDASFFSRSTIRRVLSAVCPRLALDQGRAQQSPLRI